MCVDALNEDRFGLSGTREISDCGSKEEEKSLREQTYLDVCVTESGDALDFACSDSGWLQRQHRLQDGVELCYARHGCNVRRRYSLLQAASAGPWIEETNYGRSTTMLLASRGQ